MNMYVIFNDKNIITMNSAFYCGILQIFQLIFIVSILYLQCITTT